MPESVGGRPSDGGCHHTTEQHLSGGVPVSCVCTVAVAASVIIVQFRFVGDDDELCVCVSWCGCRQYMSLWQVVSDIVVDVVPAGGLCM